jgi:hypothetical protein
VVAVVSADLVDVGGYERVDGWLFGSNFCEQFFEFFCVADIHHVIPFVGLWARYSTAAPGGVPEAAGRCVRWSAIHLGFSPANLSKLTHDLFWVHLNRDLACVAWTTFGPSVIVEVLILAVAVFASIAVVHLDCDHVVFPFGLISTGLTGGHPCKCFDLSAVRVLGGFEQRLQWHLRKLLNKHLARCH